MAFRVEKINPIDLEPRKAVGVKIPFSSSSVFESTYQTKDAIKTNLINYLLTGQGERYLNPTFGTPLRNMLFENITSTKIEEVKAIVKQGVSLYFPRVEIKNLEVIAGYDENTVTLSFSYGIRDTNIEDEVVINFEQ